MSLVHLLPLLGYLTGSLSFAVIVCRAMGIDDPRGAGSGNPGTTNVLRLGGKKAATLTLAGDVLKGVFPVLIAHALGAPEPVVALTALGAFLGHLYPLYFRFQGGKGVATAFGATMALSWPVGVGFTIVWLVVAGISRFASLASLAAASVAPAIAWLLTGDVLHTVVLACIAGLVAWRHRDNIRRLRAGTEARLGQARTG